MADAGALLDRPAADATRQLLLRRVADAERAAARLADGDAGAGEEARHDFRVALRRIRSLLRAYGKELRGALRTRDRRRLRRLVRRTSAARDLEVQLDWLQRARRRVPRECRAEVARLTAELRREQAAADARARRQVAARWPAVRERLTRAAERFTVELRTGTTPLHTSLASAAAPAITRLVDELEARMEVVRAEPDDAEISHRARTAGKRLRYVLETLADELPAADALVAELEEVQDLLGAVQDAAVRAGLLAALAADARDPDAPASDAPDPNAPDPDAPDPDAPDPDAPDTTVREDETQAARAQAVAALQAVSERERSSARARLRRRWSARGDGLLQRGHALAAQLEARERAGLEIERKYLLNRLPPHLRRRRPVRIEQGYLPGERLVERLRRVTTADGRVRCYRTVKDGRGIARVEIEEEAAASLFDALWPHTTGRRVLKERFAASDGELRWEIDRFTDRELVLAEVELSDPSLRPALPAWLAPYVVREVTDEPEFVNAVLAR